MCEYCDFIVLLDDSGEPVDHEKYWSSIAYSDHDFKMINYNFDYHGHDHFLTGMKYCPFCGKKMEVETK